MNTENAFLAPKLLNGKTLQMQVIMFNMNDESMLKVNLPGCGSSCIELKVLFKFCFFIFLGKHTLNVYSVIGKQRSRYIKINKTVFLPSRSSESHLSVGVHSCMCMCVGRRMAHVNTLYLSVIVAKIKRE